MFCRVLEAKTQPGKIPQALEIITQQAAKVKDTRGFLFVQALHSEDDMIVVSSWRTEKDLHAYAESEVAREMLMQLSSLLVGTPIVKNYAMGLAVEGDEQFFARDVGGEG